MVAALVVGTVGERDRHDSGPGHPERPQRIAAVQRGVAQAGLDDGVVHLAGRPATLDELARVHDRRYLDALAQVAAVGGGDLDPDTRMSAGSWATAQLAAGLGLEAVEALERGEAPAAFVAIRPPGHHATATRAMGFCLLNNAAVAAAALAERGERVLIVDWDVHHGNGTQDLFWDDPRVLYVSTHEWPAYPGTGRATETGGPAAPGLTVNVPLPPGATGDVALAAFDEVVAPAVERFAPTWVLISAGFDAHRADPLAGLMWSAGDYADLTSRVVRFAPRPGRVIAFLEGGYDLGALATSVEATVATLAGERRRPEPATSGGPGREAVAAARAVWDRIELDEAAIPRGEAAGR
jgi:acetoin utilization deacetylase AcuC-like enzyme